MPKWNSTALKAPTTISIISGPKKNSGGAAVAPSANRNGASPPVR